mgnify:FL=1|tara:strand:+ start:431 stop:1330 length:900 start_codon:yes stop_codon:yes gene_type:complete
MNIPKIIHQLWIGEKPRPFKAMDKVRDMNPHCEYIFWNEEKIKKDLKVSREYNRKIVSHSAINGKADMYRYLILLQYGGIWIDADILPIEPLDDFLFDKPFFCYESESVRPGLCANTILSFPKNHLYMKTMVQWILDNETREMHAEMASWDLVGPGLLTRMYHSFDKETKEMVHVFPSYYFLPDHHTGLKYKGHGKVYTTHEWGTTWNKYDKINDMDIPSHHKPPQDSITITIDNNVKPKKLKEILQSIKNISGHFKIKISYDGDINKYLKSMRFVEHIQNNSFTWDPPKELLTGVSNE